MAKKTGWIDEIAAQVKDRAHDMVDTVAVGVRGSVTPRPVPKPQQVTLDQYLTAPPELRQAVLPMLTADDFARFQDEAVRTYGPMASAIMPMLSMEEAQSQIQRAQADDPMAGIDAASAELTTLLGMDPFAQ